MMQTESDEFYRGEQRSPQHDHHRYHHQDQGHQHDHHQHQHQQQHQHRQQKQEQQEPKGDRPSRYAPQQLSLVLDGAGVGGGAGGGGRSSLFFPSHRSGRISGSDHGAYGASSSALPVGTTEPGRSPYPAYRKGTESEAGAGGGSGGGGVGGGGGGGGDGGIPPGPVGLGARREQQRRWMRVVVLYCVYFLRFCGVNIKLSCTVLYGTVLYGTVLYCTALYCTCLLYTSPSPRD